MPETCGKRPAPPRPARRRSRAPPAGRRRSPRASTVTLPNGSSVRMSLRVSIGAGRVESGRRGCRRRWSAPPRRRPRCAARRRSDCRYWSPRCARWRGGCPARPWSCRPIRPAPGRASAFQRATMASISGSGGTPAVDTKRQDGVARRRPPCPSRVDPVEREIDRRQIVQVGARLDDQRVALEDGDRIVVVAAQDEVDALDAGRPARGRRRSRGGSWPPRDRRPSRAAA